MIRRFLFFGIGALISIVFLSIGPENRLKNTFYAYVDYFNINKRVINHLKNDNISFSSKSECQLIYYDIKKEELLLVLEGGKVNFNLSQKDRDPCQYYVIEKTINNDYFSVNFEYCYIENTVKVIDFIINNKKEACVF